MAIVKIFLVKVKGRLIIIIKVVVRDLIVKYIKIVIIIMDNKLNSKRF